jgi:hypothetical protein
MSFSSLSSRDKNLSASIFTGIRNAHMISRFIFWGLGRSSRGGTGSVCLKAIRLIRLVVCDKLAHNVWPELSLTQPPREQASKEPVRLFRLSWRISQKLKLPRSSDSLSLSRGGFEKGLRRPGARCGRTKASSKKPPAHEPWGRKDCACGEFTEAVGTPTGTLRYDYKGADLLHPGWDGL